MKKVNQAKVNERIKAELTPIPVHTQYADFLDEIYPDLKIANYSYSTSNALKKLDPIAYNQGFLEYIDSLIKDKVITEEIDDEHYDFKDAENIFWEEAQERLQEISK